MGLFPDAQEGIEVADWTAADKVSLGIGQAQYDLYQDKGLPVARNYVGHRSSPHQVNPGDSPFIPGEMSNEYDYSNRPVADLAQAQYAKEKGPFLANRGAGVQAGVLSDLGYGQGAGLGITQAKLGARNDAMSRELTSVKSAFGLGSDYSASSRAASSAASSLAIDTAAKNSEQSIANTRGMSRMVGDAASAYALGVYESGGQANPFQWKSAITALNTKKYRSGPMGTGISPSDIPRSTF